MRKLAARLFVFVAWLAALACVPGGALWALSPIGVQLANERLTTGSDRFWQLFFSAPLLMLVGLLGLWWLGYVGSGWLARAGFVATGIGLLMVISGNVGQFWLGLDDIFTVAAPAYRTFRAGLLLTAAGAATFGITAFTNRTLPRWGALPFVIAAACGFVAFLNDFGTLGAGLWATFGAGWVWLGFSVFLTRLVCSLRGRGARIPFVGRSTDI